jgi:TPR repeat protein
MEGRVFCILCRYLLNRADPGWIGKVETLHQKYLLSGLNNDDMYRLEVDTARLREIYELSQSRPSEAFTQFLVLAEAGSVWSIIQIGHAYEVGRGVPADRVRAEHWYMKAYERGSDYGLLRGSILAVRRGDIAKARAMLEEGVARELVRAMTYLAWLELKLSRGEQARLRARKLYEQAIASGDFDARMSFARAMAYGQFGLRAIPTGIRKLYDASEYFSAQVDANAPPGPSAEN